MKEALRERLITILWIGLFIVLAVGVLTIIGFTIAAWSMYGNTPVAEVPPWALWFMFGGRR